VINLPLLHAISVPRLLTLMYTRSYGTLIYIVVMFRVAYSKITRSDTRREQCCVISILVA